MSFGSPSDSEGGGMEWERAGARSLEWVGGEAVWPQRSRKALLR